MTIEEHGFHKMPGRGLDSKGGILVEGEHFPGASKVCWLRVCHVQRVPGVFRVVDALVFTAVQKLRSDDWQEMPARLPCVAGVRPSRATDAWIL